LLYKFLADLSDTQGFMKDYFIKILYITCHFVSWLYTWYRIRCNQPKL